MIDIFRLTIYIFGHIQGWVIWLEIERGHLMIKSKIEIKVSWYYCIKKNI